MKFLVTIFTIKKIPVVSWSSYDILNFKPKFITLLYLNFGLILFGLGETLLITANAGVDGSVIVGKLLEGKKVNIRINTPTFSGYYQEIKTLWKPW